MMLILRSVLWPRDSRSKKHAYSATGSYAGSWYAEDLRTVKMISTSLKTTMECRGIVSKRCASFPRKGGRADLLFIEKAANLYTIEPATGAVVDIPDTVVNTNCSSKKSAICQ